MYDDDGGGLQGFDTSCFRVGDEVDGAKDSSKVNLIVRLGKVGEKERDVVVDLLEMEEGEERSRRHVGGPGWTLW